MTRCPRCNSPETPKGCKNADCALWEGPTPTGAPVPPKPWPSRERLDAVWAEFWAHEAERDRWAEEEDRRFEEWRDDKIMAKYEGGQRA